MNELRNIKVYKIYAIFNNLLILGPILTLFYLEKGLSFTQIFMITSAASITTILFEVPTGAISDKISRKFSVIIGCILCAASLVVFVVNPTFVTILIGDIIFSIGLTFRSGSEQALLYDTLKNNDKVGEYTNIEGKARSYTFIAQAIGSLLAGFLYTYNVYLPFYFSIFFVAVAGIIACFYVEPAIEKEHKEISYKNQIKDSFKYAFTHKKVFSIFLFSLVFFYFYRIGFNYFQPYMKSIGIPTVFFGAVFFLFNIVAAMSSRFTQLFIHLTKPKSLFMLCMLLVTSFILMGFTKYPIGILFMLLQQVARGLRVPIFQKYINKHLPSSKRATILSIQNLTNSIIVAVFAPFAGLLLDKTDIFTTHLVIGIIMVIFVMIVHAFMRLSIDRHEKVG